MAESKAYAGTPGTRNNPDNQIKSSLAITTTSVVYRTSTETIYLNKTEENSNYKIVSFPDVVYINEPFKIIVSLHSSEEQIVSVYSYVYDGKNLLSDGFDGVNWKGTWTANKKDIKIGSTPVYAEFENRIKSDTPPDRYQFKVRIKDKTDLTKSIEVLLEKEKPQLAQNNSNALLEIQCKQVENQAEIIIKTSTKREILLLHFSRDIIRNETLPVNWNSTYVLDLVDGYNSIALLENDELIKSCNFLLRELSVTGRATQVISVTKIFTIVKSWVENLSFLSIFRI